MNEDPKDRKTKNYILMRSVMDYGMGGLIFGFGLFFAFADKLGLGFSIEPFFRYFFAGLCIIYGAFRIYRGYKKNYFSE
jgi:hypothetical protein